MSGGNVKKPVRISSLAMRFYSSDGWTKSELESCLEKGKIAHQTSLIPDFDYFILENHSRFNPEKIKALISHVVPGFDEQPTNIEEVLAQFNW